MVETPDLGQRRMKSRRTFLGFLVAAVGSAPSYSWAQRTPRLPRIGLLTHAASKPQIPRPIAAFLEAIRELGYVDGQTIQIEFRWAEGKPERLTELAAALVRDKVDVIVATGDAPIRAALSATRTIPIVMATSGDAVGSGFISSLAHPGGNVTGMTAVAPELGAKRLQLVKELLPRAATATVLWSPDDPVHAFEWTHMRAAENAIGVKLQSMEFRSREGVGPALSRLEAAPAEALIVLHNNLVREHREHILAFAAKKKLPAMYEAAEYVDAGGLMAYGVAHAELFRRSARHVAKILKGTEPADIPVEQPTRLELVFNRRAATTLGVTIPGLLLLRADRVVE